MAEIDALRKAGDLEGAAQRAFTALQELQDSDLTARMRIPLTIASTPAGAEVLLGGKPTGQGHAVRDRLRARSVTRRSCCGSPGARTTSSASRTTRLVQRAPESLKNWSPRLTADLPEGLRWRIQHLKERA